MASGDTLVIFTAQHFEPIDSDYAGFDVRNNHPVLDYDDYQVEYSYFSGVLPRHYGGSGITAYIHWAASTAETGDVVWKVAFERIGDEVQDIDSDGFATAKSVTGTTSTTSGYVVIDSIAFSNGSEIDSLAVGEYFRIYVCRQGDDANDTMSGDAEFVAIELKET